MRCQVRLLVLAAAGAVLLTTQVAGAAAAPTVDWIHRFGGPFLDLGHAVTADETGGYVAGATLGAIPGQTEFGAQDAFIRKVDGAATPLWTDQFGTGGFDGIGGLATASGDVYAAGWTGGALPGQESSGNADAFVRRYSSGGQVLWTTQFGTGEHDEAVGVAVDGGSAYVVGTTVGQLGSGSGGSTDIFVRRLASDGQELWTTQLERSGPQTGRGISVHGNGVYVVGCTSWFCGSFNGADAYVARLSAADGALVWERSFGATDAFAQDEAQGVAADTSGVYVAGWTQGTLTGQASAGFLDIFVRKYDADGGEVWTRQFGSSLDDRGLGVAIGPGGVVVAGSAGAALPGQTGFGSDDVFARAYERDGGELATIQLGTRDVETARAVAIRGDATFLAGDGVVFGPVQFGIGLPDAFIARLTLFADTAPPVLDLPSGVTADAIGPGGAFVVYAASAVDAVDGPVPVVCDPPSGVLFPIGDTTVDCSATDAAGNRATRSFTAHVKDADEQLADLLALVDDLGLDKLGTSLHDKLVAAQRHLAAGRLRHAEESIEAFVAQVEAQRAKALTEDQVDALVTAAGRILEVIES